MYYELYIDILYLVNFMMDYLLLLLAKKFSKCSTTHIRILLASLIGSFLSCVVFVLPISYESIKFILFHVVINTVMIRIGFKIKDKFVFIKCLGSLYVGSFLLGGILQYFQQYLKLGSLFFAMSVISYWLTKGVWSFICFLQKYQEKWYEVEIYIQDSVVRVRALLDTGNGLCDPYTGKPVCIVEKEVLSGCMPSYCENMKLEEDESGDSVKSICYRYIPYHSIGKDGVMLAINVEKIHVCGVNEYWVENPILAISEEPISVNKNYQMILNPDIL